jgi:predicted DNA-binding protein
MECRYGTPAKGRYSSHVKRKSLRLDDDLAERLLSCARADGLSESEFIRRAIQQALDSAEPLEIPATLTVDGVLSTYRTRDGQAFELIP